MDLFSPTFFVFFLAILLLYYFVGIRYQKYLLVIASSVFIGSLSISILIHTYLFILITYVFALFVSRQEKNQKTKKIIFNSGIVVLIGVLVFFKYTNFILSSTLECINFFNPNISIPEIKIIAPIGISYYTFQGIGYLLQIYRGIEPLEKDILIFSNYFLFFPKFLAGPIEQSKNFLPQLKQKHNFVDINILDGFRLIMWGAFKKLVIADRLDLIINGVYPNLHEMSGNAFLITFLIQPLHLYCDFSGYTDIALGIGRTFGFKLTDNFKRPFFSTSVTEFWQRWHISLSSWCNEYIFKRLSFKHRRWKKWAPVYAVFVTFFVIGIWHGPRWNFVLLGILQGIAINYEFFTKRFRLTQGSKLPKNLVLYSSYILVYLFFCFTLILFNATSVSDALYFMSHIFNNINTSDLSLIFLSKYDKIVVLVSLLVVFIVEYRQEILNKDILYDVYNWPKWLRWAFYYTICFLVIYFGNANQEFVYMQF
jgi:alginate O-acetyltransferase complex protein AlgI